MPRKTAASSASPSPKKTVRQTAAPRVSRSRRPEDMQVEDWQIALRRQFGREQEFHLDHLGGDPVFAEYAVTNPASKRCYRVVVRGARPGDNSCTCPDFMTNDLGTCKHIEFTLARIEKTPGGQAALQRGFRLGHSEIYLDYARRRTVRLRLGANSTPEFRTLAAGLFDEAAAWALSPARFAGLPSLLDLAASIGHELRCNEDVLAYIAEHRDAEARRRRIDQLYPEGADSPVLAELLKERMYPYQLEGALFAVRTGRALIGDEMGLGKTVQAIAAMELFARHLGVERVLVICPTSLKHQWKREIARFSTREAQVIGGLRAQRRTAYLQETFCKIANYESVTRDLEFVDAWAPDLVILDEAQRIKNWNTQAARALKRIASPYAVVLTGTPLENRLEELISIVQFVDQYRLGPTWKLLHSHQKTDDNGRVIGYCELDRINTTLSDILLRRRKAEVLTQLPERVDNTLFVAMTAPQREYHEDNREIVARIAQRWRNTGYLSDADQKRLTCALQNMRMSCNSTFLLDHETDHGHKADELMALLEDLFEQPGSKAVVFSQWLRMHELIVRRLSARGWDYVLFHGGVPAEKRGALVDRFNEKEACRVFLSTDAGGVGLNLQHAAACVVNMDLPWNPAVLEQRIGRVHRIGQTRGVQVVNFVAQGSIEEGILSLLAFKKSLFSGVLDGGQNEVFLEGSRLSRFMESVEQATGAANALEFEPLGEEASAPELASSPLEPLAQPQADDAKVGAGETVAAVAVATAAPSAAPVEPEAAATPSPDPWGPLLNVGLKFLQELGQASAAGGDHGARTASASSVASWLETDPHTGQRFLKLPVPEPQTVQRLADALQGVLNGLRKP